MMRGHWDRQWAHFRNEYIAGKFPPPIVAQVTASPADGWRWECSECSDGGFGRSEKEAESRGRGHTQTHISSDLREELEDLKVQMMPDNLLTFFQRSRREELQKGKALTHLAPEVNS